MEPTLHKSRWFRSPLLIGAMLVTALGVFFVVIRYWWIGGGLLALAFAMERVGSALYSKPRPGSLPNGQEAPPHGPTDT